MCDTYKGTRGGSNGEPISSFEFSHKFLNSSRMIKAILWSKERCRLEKEKNINSYQKYLNKESENIKMESKHKNSPCFMQL